MNQNIAPVAFPEHFHVAQRVSTTAIAKEDGIQALAQFRARRCKRHNATNYDHMMDRMEPKVLLNLIKTPED